MVSSPSTSSAPDGPAQSSPLRSGGQFRTWFTNITEWIRGLSPAGQPYATDWIVGAGKLERFITIDQSVWPVLGFVASRSGLDVDMQLWVTYQGPPITVPEDGDIQNLDVGTVLPAFRPRYFASLAGGPAGPPATGAVSPSGMLQICSVSPGSTLEAGRQFALQGMWRVAHRDAA